MSSNFVQTRLCRASASRIDARMGAYTEVPWPRRGRLGSHACGRKTRTEYIIAQGVEIHLLLIGSQIIILSPNIVYHAGSG